MADFDDYERLPGQHSLLVHIMAGSLAGVAEHTVMYPVDSVKTRMQSLCKECPERSCRTPLSAITSVVRREGFVRLYKGVTSVASASVVAHALYFGVYEELKLHLRKSGLFSGQLEHFAHGLAGAAATIGHDLIMNPAEMVKQRNQMFCCPFKSNMECVKKVYRTEGIVAFYRSFPTQLLLNIPFHSLQFTIYEHCQSLVNPKRDYSPKTHLLSGALSGAIASAVTTPLDVIKTVLNTQEKIYVNSGKSGAAPPFLSKISGTLPTRSAHTNTAVDSGAIVHGLKEACSSVLRAEGPKGFLKGLQARMIVQSSGVAVIWFAFETLKHVISWVPMEL